MSKKSNNKSGMSMKTKWIITGILCVLAVLTVVIVAAAGCFDFEPGSVPSTDTAAAARAAPDADKDTAKTGGTHTVLVTAGNGGTTDPTGSLTVEDWERVKINFTPNEGYEIQSISVDGKDMGAIESYELSNVTEDHSIIATFVKKAVPTPTPAPATPTPDDGE